MTSKRYFRINPGIWGAEFLMGSVSAEFAQYWHDRDREELLDHVRALEDGEGADGYDVDSPPPQPDWEGAWFNFDDLASSHVPFVTGTPTFEEILLHKDATFDGAEILWMEGINHGDDVNLYDVVGGVSEFEFANILTLQNFQMRQTKEPQDGMAPAIGLCDEEKGFLGYLVVETDMAGFDGQKLVIGSLATDFGDFAERFWYDGNEISLHGEPYTEGKGMRAHVGFVNLIEVSGVSEETIQQKLSGISQQ